VETTIYELPRRDGIPVLSPFQQPIERGETLRCLRRQLEADCEGADALRRALSSLDRLYQEELEEMAFRELLGE
jgi:hypothetical protein